MGCCFGRCRAISGQGKEVADVGMDQDMRGRSSETGDSGTSLSQVARSWEVGKRGEEAHHEWQMKGVVPY